MNSAIAVLIEAVFYFAIAVCLGKTLKYLERNDEPPDC